MIAFWAVTAIVAGALALIVLWRVVVGDAQPWLASGPLLWWTHRRGCASVEGPGGRNASQHARLVRHVHGGRRLYECRPDQGGCGYRWLY